MKTKFIHPLWTHIPAILALLAAVVFTLRAMPLPDPAPLHFTWSGQPDRYGSPWMSAIWQAAISVLCIILSVVLDEAWARQERQKTFNWISLFDDVTVAALATVQITYVDMLASSNYVYPFPWAWTIVAAALAAGLAIVLERMRPFRRYESSLVIEDMGQVKVEVSRIVKAGQPLFYWEVQNPTYSRVLAVVVPLLMVVVAVTAWTEVPWFSVIMALVGIALALIYGGFRTIVTREAVMVRMGLLGIRLLRLKTSDITSVELHSFSPLKDFGGYGIRFNREMKAYFLKGDRGAKITARTGKKYLIGSDHPERLTTVISTIIG
ncbi:MAG: DUF1648 domain-containing protein [Chloroflexi bacterium]|nr:DUF1648 domain-containing protein [Chloroflexota bacterium]